MLTKWRGRERRGLIVLAVLVMGVGLTAAVMAAPQLDFAPVRRNLSETPDQVSAYPDLATSPNGDWMAVAWVEQKKDVCLRVAAVGGDGWEEKLQVFSGTGSEAAYGVATAIQDDGDVYVAYVVFKSEGITITKKEVRYTVCLLVGEDRQCADPPVLVDEATGDEIISWVDLALDGSGSPHIVWTVTEDPNSHVYYAHGGPGEKMTDFGDNLTPAIAWAGGYAHIVWKEDDGGRIQYRRPPSDTISLYENTVSPPGHPDVVADGSGRVFVVWERCIGSPCQQYHVLYCRSNDGGETWGPVLEVGTDEASDIDMTAYRSLDDPRERVEYLLDLQPFVALNSTGWPAVVWHADRSEGSGADYVVHYSYAISGTVDRAGWITSTVLSQLKRMWGSAAVGVAEPIEGDQYLHIVYMQQQDTGWDVYYDSTMEEEIVSYAYMPLVMRHH